MAKLRWFSPWSEPTTHKRADLAVPPVNVRQVVAYNLKLGRTGREMSQKDLAGELRRLTGKKWTVAAVSAAEQGWAARSPRLRSFDVTDVIAFSLALRLPLSWFFLPPTATPQNEEVDIDAPWIHLGRPDEEVDEVQLMTPRFLAWLAFNHDAVGDDPLIEDRLSTLPDEGRDPAPKLPSIKAGWERFTTGVDSFEEGRLHGLQAGRQEAVREVAAELQQILDKLKKGVPSSEA
ncbi:hypothetical protein G5V58_04135 [Nocardioides anomalus]|uniref:Uncharacterized protein n=1 Tax=Nocardioides anomalus TaxID=2712223 RepID=A0A6G6WA40_9ACTN|nr:hypothetical protein [Nocardioides anomalus]QIG42069.1 hypothetical protein G5V58_04135 [Nocardioides anomalus]